jgi:protein-tyrosine phosphatase
LLERGLVHVIASDAHDLEHRPPVMDAAYAWLKRHYDEGLAQALCVKNPGMVLRGEPLGIPYRKSGASSRKWYEFWR